MTNCFVVVCDFCRLVFEQVSIITSELHPIIHGVVTCEILVNTICIESVQEFYIPCDNDLAVSQNPHSINLGGVRITDENAFDGSGLEFSFIRFLVENKRLTFERSKMTYVGFFSFP